MSQHQPSHFDQILERASGVPVNQQQANRRAQQAATQAQGSLPAGQEVPLSQAVGPVISLEKTDIEFWVNIGQLLLLILIWRKL